MRDLSDEKIAIIGGGLGGLCAALCFAARGARVRVFEASPSFGDVGAGIQAPSNALRVLRAIGIDPGRAMRSQGMTLNDNAGRRVAILPNERRREIRLFHRADLLKLLEEACRARGIEINLGARVDPANPPEADLIVAADGVKSRFRAHVCPDLATASFSGQIAWRALVPAPGGIAEAGVNVYMGAGQHVVVYPLRDGKQINIVAAEDAREGAPEGWREQAAQHDLAQRFSQFGGPLPELFARATEVHRWGLFNHALPPRWSDGNVALLGDAAHAMLPYLAQGAAMAFEDAYELARAWAALDDPDAALGAYERRRAPRVERVMKEARANATRFHHQSPLARFIGYSGLRAASSLAPGLISARFNWLYNFDVTSGG
ncbi:MAG: FAD-dependent monooxygenase [Pseudomonadota bacterium]